MQIHQKAYTLIYVKRRITSDDGISMCINMVPEYYIAMTTTVKITISSEPVCGFHMRMRMGLGGWSKKKQWELRMGTTTYECKCECSTQFSLSLSILLAPCIWQISLDFSITLFIWKETICVCVTSNYRLKSYKRCKRHLFLPPRFLAFYIYVCNPYVHMLKHEC